MSRRKISSFDATPKMNAESIENKNYTSENIKVSQAKTRNERLYNIRQGVSKQLLNKLIYRR